MDSEERTGYRSGDPNFQPPPPERPEGGGAKGAGSGGAAAPRCDLCGAPMLERNCKLECVTCGYQRDCSDP